ncbi:MULTISPECIES: thiamine pyrophosphate-dependent enzyme [unclassified Nocardioides]|uniref:thiamine pyrophosphate-dependent enzyme n=1 Tax=unclassified Nocardioides TaxID=2615069 RepID=UPI0013FDA0C4|nr:MULTISPECIES: thiamine pyrophosphate-dependent enzyme [unclassified Nocardioides]
MKHVTRDWAAEWATGGGEPLRFLGPDGGLVQPDLPRPPDDLVREALRLMLLSRALDEKCTNLHRQGRLGLYAPVQGQEAAVVGSHLAIDPAVDWLVPASREQPAMLRHGWALDRMLASFLGRIDAARIPDHVRMLPRQQSIAAQLPHAVGIAWATSIRGLDGVTLAYCGDGATSEGDFHEACNLAGVMGVPLVLVVINNQYAISTPVSRQTRATRLADRARGYGFPGVAVDGDDLFAMYEVTRQAVERARAGQGPTMIEAVTYRMSFHNTSDNPSLYRDPSEVATAGQNDPVARLVAYATGAGVMRPDAIEAVEAEVRAEVEAALDRALSHPAPGPEEIFRHVFAD